MTRQSISLTSPNDEWLKAQLANEEYSSKSEVVNDLIRQARKREEAVNNIRNQLIKAEESGVTQEVDPKAMLKEFKDRLSDNGQI
ncbi:MAG: CopG family transcriptional regulator [Alphaproteobacteria bacterium CG11_big_fil_rev_8_21_14_0_20_39_49]|nr:MAG: CopG family transcriptional regulator [Alphaproteobacteria bacterium CG11_big_fil_rev_8_21_14_0_20_39_49]